MKTIFCSILIVLFSNLFAFHKDKVKIKNFGNVKTLYISEFNFGEKIVSSEEIKMEILGELSRQLAEKLGFKDTIMLERKTFLYQNKNDIIIVENNDDNYKFLKLHENYIKPDAKTANGVAVRIMSPSVKIEHVLKLVEFALKNRSKLKKCLVQTDYYFDDDVKISIPANSEKFISNILSNNSVLVDSVMQKEFILFKDHRKILSWQSNEFVFKENRDRYQPANLYAQIVTDELKMQDFYYYIRNVSYDYFLVFSDKNTFNYFDGDEGHTSKKINIEKGYSFYPFRTSLEKIYGKVVIYDHENYFIYNVYKKTLQKIE